MPATTTVKIPGVPGEVAFGDYIHDREWSTSQVAATQSTQLPILAAAAGEAKPGAAGVTLTVREATIPAGGQRGFPAGYEGYIYSLQLVFGSASGVKTAGGLPTSAAPTDASIISLYCRTLFSFKVQNKLKSHGPLAAFPAGMGMWLTGTDFSNGAANRLYTSNGAPSPRDKAAFILPHHLEANIPFSGYLDFDAALVLSGTMDIEGHIEGLLKRPVT